MKGGNTHVERSPLTPPRLADDPTILVVDDDFDARTIVAEYLRTMGCIVYTAADGVEAIEEATARLPDLIVLDLALPNLDGWAAAERLKRSERTSRIPIIAISAVPGARDSAWISGCDAYLSKPCLPQLLWSEISVLLGLSPTLSPI